MPLSWIAFVIGYVASWFVTIGGALTNWALDLNSQVINSPTVQIGWVVSRDLANLGFVLAIILIAFATIIRYENYEMKKLLGRLIAAALLVNFSLVIAGVFLDFTGILTNFFIDKATNYDSAKLGAGLANAFKVQTLAFPKTDAESIRNKVQGLNDDANSFVQFYTSQVFVGIFTVIVAMSLISLAAMLYIRYLALTILLILAPLAWLFWIWPDVEKYWTDWWREFMRWAFFAPAVTFFIYLALSIALQFEESPGLAPIVADLNDPSFTTGLLLKEWGTSLGQMISVLGILYGGLYVANKMGIAGANAGLAVAKGVKNGLIGGGLLAGGAIAGLGMRQVLKAGAKEGQESYAQKLGSRLQAAPLKFVRDAGLALRERSTSALRSGTAKEAAEVRDRIENAGYASYDSAKNAVAGARTDTEKAAWAQFIINKGWDKDVGDAKMGELLRAAEAVGGKDFKETVQSRPDLAKHLAKLKTGQTREQAEEQAIINATQSIGDPLKIKPDAYKNAAVALSQSKNAFERLITKGSDKHLEAYSEGLWAAAQEISTITDTTEKAAKETILQERLNFAYANPKFAPHVNLLMQRIKTIYP